MNKINPIDIGIPQNRSNRIFLVGSKKSISFDNYDKIEDIVENN